MKNQLLDVINEWALTTTIHAVPNIFRSKNTAVKVIWVISLVIFAGWCFFMVIGSISQFFEFEVVTQIKSIYELPAIFPAVTICNSNSFTTQRSLEYVKKYLEVLNVSDIESVDWSNLYGSGSRIHDQLDETLFTMKQTVQRYIMYNTTDAEKRELGFSVEDTILNCYFNYGNCELNDFSWYFDINYGNCFTFNSKRPNVPLKSNIKGGYEAGLQIGIFTGTVDSIYALSSGLGAHVFVHNQSVRPSFTQGIDVAPGFKTSIQIGRTITLMTPTPFNECQNDFDDVPYYQIIKDTPFSYRQQDCFFYVYQERVVEKCGCYDLAYPKPQNSNLGCLTVNQSVCLINVASDTFSTSSLSDLYAACPLECESSTIAFSTAFLEYPSRIVAEQYAKRDFMKKRFAKITNLTLTPEMVKQNTVWLNIYYDDLFYTFITEKPKTTSLDLISSVGGTLGLFLGCSLLSFIELVEIILTVITIKIQSKSTKKLSKVSK